MGSITLPATLADWLDLLELRHPKAIDLGLDRCGEVWRRMGSPAPAPKIFMVAGTNGKGSTVATLCALLDASGYRYGSYTSPHLVRYNERVLINGEAVSDEASKTAPRTSAVETVRHAPFTATLSPKTRGSSGVKSTRRRKPPP